MLMWCTVTSWNWPTDFPDDCPPEQASPADGTFYRIVADDPPKPADFISVFHLNPYHAMREIRRGSRTECDTKGLSVYMDKIDALGCARQFPKIGKMIASVALTPVAGKVLDTDGLFRSHHTWWKVSDFDPTGIAQVVDRV